MSDDKEKTIGEYNLMICVTEIGYQIDFIDPKKYNEYYGVMEDKGIITGAMCRDYGVDVNQDRAVQAILHYVMGLENEDGIELTEEEYKKKEEEMKKLFGE